jgi:chromosome segregation ATPase
MAENVPPPNATNASVVLAEGDLIAGNTLANLNGNRSRGLGSKSAKGKKLDAKLDLERQKTRTALKDLADLETKLAKLGVLSDKRGLKVSELQLELKANRKSAVADLNVLKKTHKKELKVESDLAGDKVKAAVAKVKAQLSLSKDVESAKKTLQKKFDGQSKTLELLQKAFQESKRRSSELSADLVASSRSKDELKDNIKVLNKTMKSLKSKLDNQLEQKNDHDYRMQKMKNEYKQMGLDELREKLTKKKTGGSSSGPMSLEEKKDFVSHQALVKQAGKDNDLARAVKQKEIKKKDVQSNLVYSANMMHSTSNMNGGNWSSKSVGDVSG